MKPTVGGAGWFEGLSEARVVSGEPGPVSDVCYDSRRATPGCLFVAVPGLVVDGHDYIEQALRGGATALLVQLDRRAAWQHHASGGRAVVAVPDTRLALAEAAAGFWGHPARSLGVVGVTGTDGKTTTTHLVAHVLNRCGMAAGYLSSVEFGLPESAELNASHMTTLEAPEVQRHLARVRGAGGRYAAVEASSIGLAMHRVDQCEFDAGVFTNLTPDHLDYHGTMERYVDAKGILFEMVGRSVDKGLAKAAVLNADDAASAPLPAKARVPVRTYGLRSEAEFKATDITYDADGMWFRANWHGEERKARMRLLGEYNVSNALAALAVAVSQGAAFGEAVEALASFAGVPGRMEAIDAGQPFRVIVDIASTEQAMSNVLRVLRRATEARIIVVFGAAGERDRERRSGIARAVAADADYAVLTNEDPRSEDPEAIIGEIAAALAACGFDEGAGFERITDRRAAIARAFALAAAGDCVLLAGKGTEQSIVIGTTHHPWDERVVARELLGGAAGV